MEGRGGEGGGPFLIAAIVPHTQSSPIDIINCSNYNLYNQCYCPLESVMTDVSNTTVNVTVH